MNKEFEVNVNQLEKVGEGGFTEAYFLETEYGKYVKKVPNFKKLPFWMFQQLRAKHIAESYIVAFPGSSVNVPRVVSVNHGDNPYVIETFAYGDKIYPWMLREFSPSKRAELANRLGGFLANLHSLEVSRIRVSCKAEDMAHIKARRRVAKDNLARFLSNPLVRNTFPVFGRVSNNHGDFCPQNILYDKLTDTLSVIDWGSAIIWGSKTDIKRFAKKERKNTGFSREFACDIINAYNDSPLTPEYAKIRRNDVSWPKIKRRYIGAVQVEKAPIL